MEQLLQPLGISESILSHLTDMAYHILALAIGAWAIVRGFRKGITRQMCGLLGFAFGIVSARILAEPGEAAARSIMPAFDGPVGDRFIYSIASGAAIFTLVFFIFRWTTASIGRALQAIDTGVLDSLLGSGFHLAKSLLFLSVAFNGLVCLNPQSRLMKYASDSDGNVVEAVMQFAPAVLGCMSFDELSHAFQLEDARKISQNLYQPQGVNYSEGGKAKKTVARPGDMTT